MADTADGLSWTGLSAKDLELYRLALSEGPDAATDAPSAQVARLAAAGFLVDGRAVAPATALRSLLHVQLARAHARFAELEEAAEHVDAVASRFVGATPGIFAAHGIEMLTGAAAVGERANALIDSARSELMVLNAPPYAQLATDEYDNDPAKAPPASESGTGLAVARGVRVRHIFAREGLDLPGRMAAVGELAGAGMGVRVHPAVPTKLMVIDRRLAILPPSPAADPLESAAVLHDGLLVNALVPLFEMLWDSAVPLGAVPAAPAVTQHAGDAASGPTDDERALIAMLASGLKDEAIARQLDVHVHTARRRITALVERLDATTRFQAGLQAARRGWLDEGR